jgi:hypothetical protein
MCGVWNYKYLVMCDLFNVFLTRTWMDHRSFNVIAFSVIAFSLIVFSTWKQTSNMYQSIGKLSSKISNINNQLVGI